MCVPFMELKLSSEIFQCNFWQTQQYNSQPDAAESPHHTQSSHTPHMNWKATKLERQNCHSLHHKRIYHQRSNHQRHHLRRLVIDGTVFGGAGGHSHQKHHLLRHSLWRCCTHHYCWRHHQSIIMRMFKDGWMDERGDLLR